MTVQTTYSTTHQAAYAGMLVDLQLYNTTSKLNKGTAIIPYGKGVVTEDEDGAQLPDGTSTAAQFVGVVMYEINRAQVDPTIPGIAAAVEAGIPPDYEGTIITFGTVWVTAAATVAKDDPAFLRVGATNNGDFSNAAGSGATASVALTNAKFLTGGDAGDLVQLSLGLGG